MDYDVVVIGGSAAGLSAALVLTRARRRVLVVDDGAPRNAPAAHIQGFLTRDGTPPAQFLAAGRAEVAGYGGEFADDRVVSVTSGFGVELAGGRRVRARRLLVATGLTDVLPDLPGLRERWGKDVVHCPYCHGWEVRDQKIGVLGWHPMSPHQALLVRGWSADVTYLVHGDLGDHDRTRLLASGIKIEDYDGWDGPLFVGPEPKPNDALLTSLGCELDEQGWVRVDRTWRTSVPGVWAAGNVVDRGAQVITAAGQGAQAAAMLNMDLTEEDTTRAVQRWERAERVHGLRV